MLTELHYEDGLVIRGRSEDDMLASAEVHIRRVHSELADLITRDQVGITVREAPFALRANGLDLTQRVFRRCPFADWELSLVYGLPWDPSRSRHPFRLNVPRGVRPHRDLPPVCPQSTG